ncbi:AbrB/MazE/SpoVT family DNA-binding domain-containing protein [Salicibibacter cibarius]|uniref:AbrB/MazE/SpoVT family DNA-binding domain-containing protein n=1 Tax=Salicibibacter cibarius TaxID=2743000 RepID=A0A7T6Z5L1_9BACI|nr:AbrB/MazE/SpoVT family DNA-binding domain-containing protein [Salicibibacter cibarius]QQK77326.1 AbrB/MazE/SpoVT family DNA-binding domain-containing protein [Salicibibacter cibarius]
MKNETKVKLFDGGKVVIPVKFRNALGLDEGDELILRMDQGSLRLLTDKQAIKKAQSVVRRYTGKNRSLAEEVIAERRKGVGY